MYFSLFYTIFLSIPGHLGQPLGISWGPGRPWHLDFSLVFSIYPVQALPGGAPWDPFLFPMGLRGPLGDPLRPHGRGRLLLGLGHDVIWYPHRESVCGERVEVPSARHDFSYRIVSGVLVIAKIPGKGRVLTYRVG